MSLERVRSGGSPRKVPYLRLIITSATILTWASLLSQVASSFPFQRRRPQCECEPVTARQRFIHCASVWQRQVADQYEPHVVSAIHPLDRSSDSDDCQVVVTHLHHPGIHVHSRR